MREPWKVIGGVVAVLAFAGSIIAWVISVERRLSQQEMVLQLNQRVANLEELLVPVLTEYRVRELLREMGISVPVGPAVPDEPTSISGELPRVMAESQEWAENETMKFRPEMQAAGD